MGLPVRAVSSRIQRDQKGLRNVVTFELDKPLKNSRACVRMPLSTGSQLSTRKLITIEAQASVLLLSHVAVQRESMKSPRGECTLYTETTKMIHLTRSLFGHGQVNFFVDWEKILHRRDKAIQSRQTLVRNSVNFHQSINQARI